MKRLVVFLSFLAICAYIHSQEAWKGFFQPMSAQRFDRMVATRGDRSIYPKLWVFRPAVSITAMKLIYDKELKQLSSTSFTSLGIGAGYQHYINVDGLPYNNFGFNLLMLYTAIPTETTKSGISLAGTVSALKFIDLGVGYDFDVKQAFGLMGIKYNF
jgi:hypothetical protein